MAQIDDIKADLDITKTNLQASLTNQESAKLILGKISADGDRLAAKIQELEDAIANGTALTEIATLVAEAKTLSASVQTGTNEANDALSAVDAKVPEPEVPPVEPQV